LASKIPLDFTETVLVARVTRKQGFHVMALTPPMRAVCPPSVWLNISGASGSKLGSGGVVA
jgi:hypothetical protein